MWLHYIWLLYIIFDYVYIFIPHTYLFIHIYIYTLYFQASPFPFSNGTSCPHPQGRHFNNTSSWKPFAGNVGRLGVAAEVFLSWYWNHFRKPLDFLWDFHGTVNGVLFSLSFSWNWWSPKIVRIDGNWLLKWYPQKFHRRSRLIRGGHYLACILDMFGSHILQEALAHRERD